MSSVSYWIAVMHVFAIQKQLGSLKGGRAAMGYFRLRLSI
jgi:hypothetical protein